MTMTPFQRMLDLIGLSQPWASLVLEALVVFLFVMLTLTLSGFLVGRFVRPFSPPPSGAEPTDIRPPDPDTGRIVGKCENVLVVLFVVANAITGLALIFTAKAFVRQKEFQQNPRYYLVGTMVNITFSVVMGLLAKLVLAWGQGAASFL